MLMNVNQSFHCTNCGNEFKGLGIEWRATAFVQPLRCPKCGSWHTRPSSIFGCISNRFYRPIWNELDEWSKKNLVHPDFMDPEDIINGKDEK